MSNKKLEGATADGLYGPFYPEVDNDRFMEAYKVNRYHHKPIKLPFLKYFSGDILLMLLFGDITFYEKFVTQDGTQWVAIGFEYKTGVGFIFAFPTSRDRHHENGTVSGHRVAVFTTKREPTDEEIGNVYKAVERLFEGARHDYDFKPRTT